MPTTRRAILPKLQDLVGRRFGMLVVVAKAHRQKGHWKWQCKCDCGGESVVFGLALKAAMTHSCGCIGAAYQQAFPAKAAAISTKHGAAKRGRMAPEYKVWRCMRNRCNDPNATSYENYGGRGVRVCAEWDDYAAFLAALGPRPSAAHTLDRINPNGNYEPGNCRWVTRDIQQFNRRAKSSSGVPGVHWSKKDRRWRWSVTRRGQSLGGQTADFNEAVANRAAAAKQLYGEYA